MNTYGRQPMFGRPPVGQPSQPVGALSVPPAFKMPPASQSAFTQANPHARFLSTLPGAPQMTNPVPPAMNNPLLGTPSQMRSQVREMALGGGGGGGNVADLLQRIFAARGMNAGRRYPGT